MPDSARSPTVVTRTIDILQAAGWSVIASSSSSEYAASTSHGDQQGQTWVRSDRALVEALGDRGRRTVKGQHSGRR